MKYTLHIYSIMWFLIVSNIKHNIKCSICKPSEIIPDPIQWPKFYGELEVPTIGQQTLIDSADLLFAPVGLAICGLLLQGLNVGFVSARNLGPLRTRD